MASQQARMDAGSHAESMVCAEWEVALDYDGSVGNFGLKHR